MFSSLQQATHRLRTGFGGSDLTFRLGIIPFQGCGQGNGAGPAMWVAISTVLMNMMTALGHGFHFLSPLTHFSTTATFLGFVDDTDVCEAAHHPDSGSWRLLPRIQSAVSHWAEGVLATGGAIRPDKSWWCLIDFQWCPLSR